MKFFNCTHIHPNNSVDFVLKDKEIIIPPVLEFSFLRKDRGKILNKKTGNSKFHKRTWTIPIFYVFSTLSFKIIEIPIEVSQKSIFQQMLKITHEDSTLHKINNDSI